LRVDELRKKFDFVLGCGHTDVQNTDVHKHVSYFYFFFILVFFRYKTAAQIDCELLIERGAKKTRVLWDTADETKKTLRGMRLV